jgi:hypothetical protein
VAVSTSQYAHVAARVIISVIDPALARRDVARDDIGDVDSDVVSASSPKLSSSSSTSPSSASSSTRLGEP